MSIVSGVVLGATIALLLVLVPVMALQRALRFFRPPGSALLSVDRTEQGQHAPFTKPRTRRLRLFRAVH